MFPRCRVQWWSVANTVLNCCNIREGIARLCDSWVVKTDFGLWGYLESVTAAFVQCNKLTAKVKREYK